MSAGQLSATNPNAGTRQIVQNLTTEALARVSDDGRIEPQLADTFTVARDGRSLKVVLKSGLKFHDGTPVDAATVVALLPQALRNFAGSIFDDVDRIQPLDSHSFEIKYRRPSPLLLETLEVPIRKPGPNIVATGPFVPLPGSTTELRASNAYYLGRPEIDGVTMKAFPSVRAAWAELLRNNIDMLYEVGPDALDSLESSTSVGVFTFTRRYQYVLAFNSVAPSLQSPVVRRAINFAINRQDVVTRALNGHGIPSTGPIWPKYWAIADSVSSFTTDQRRAAELVGRKQIRFRCLIFSDPLYERIALEIKRQLATVGIEMDVRSGTPDQLFDAEKKRDYDAILTETISGPTLFRLYAVWHSMGVANPGGRENPTIDAALDRVRNAANETDYRTAAGHLQQAFVENPPGAFLAWSERARAVSRRFMVPPPEPGADVLRTLRLWTPRNDERVANRN